jgi:hypothetical protein
MRFANLIRNVLDATSLCIAANTCLRGRQTFWFIIQEFTGDASAEHTYSLGDLSLVVIHDKFERVVNCAVSELENSWSRWNSTLARPDNEYLKSVLYPKIEKCEILQDDNRTFIKNTDWAIRDEVGYVHWEKVIKWHINEQRSDASQKARRLCLQHSDDSDEPSVERHRAGPRTHHNRDRSRPSHKEERRDNKRRDSRPSRGECTDAAPALPRPEHAAAASSNDNPDMTKFTKSGKLKSELPCRNVQNYGKCRDQPHCPWLHCGVEMRQSAIRKREAEDRGERPRPPDRDRHTAGPSRNQGGQKGDRQRQNPGGIHEARARKHDDEPGTVYVNNGNRNSRQPGETSSRGRRQNRGRSSDRSSFSSRDYDDRSGTDSGYASDSQRTDSRSYDSRNGSRSDSRISVSSREHTSGGSQRRTLSLPPAPPPAAAPGAPDNPKGKGKDKGKGKGKGKGKERWTNEAGEEWRETRPCYNFDQCTKQWCQFVHAPNPNAGQGAEVVTAAAPAAADAAPAETREETIARLLLDPAGTAAGEVLTVTVIVEGVPTVDRRQVVVVRADVVGESEKLLRRPPGPQ